MLVGREHRDRRRRGGRQPLDREVDHLPLHDAGALGVRCPRGRDAVGHPVDAPDEVGAGGQAGAREVGGEVVELDPAAGGQPGDDRRHRLLVAVRRPCGVAGRALGRGGLAAAYGVVLLGDRGTLQPLLDGAAEVAAASLLGLVLGAQHADLLDPGDQLVRGEPVGGGGAVPVAPGGALQHAGGVLGGRLLLPPLLRRGLLTLDAGQLGLDRGPLLRREAREHFPQPLLVGRRAQALEALLDAVEQTHAREPRAARGGATPALDRPGRP
ncbi:MAG: hypothetical protein CMH83_11880 [Nocardioides sp.]|nr:hypothetical protein [Nocardioides sp.]